MVSREPGERREIFELEVGSSAGTRAPFLCLCGGGPSTRALKVMRDFEVINTTYF